MDSCLNKEKSAERIAQVAHVKADADIVSQSELILAIKSLLQENMQVSPYVLHSVILPEK